MSTHSILARPTPDGGWEGRSCHSDGYPSYQLTVLLQMAATAPGGVAQLVKYLIDEHTRWSRLGGSWGLRTGFVHLELDGTDRQGRQLVHNRRRYAVHRRRNQCYCHGDRHDGGDMVHNTSADLRLISWIYILRSDRVDVLWSEKEDGRYVKIGSVPWGSSPEVATQLVTTIECGSNFERCCCGAYRHVPAIAKRMHRLLERNGEYIRRPFLHTYHALECFSMQQWLGLVPLNYRVVAEVTIQGVRYRILQSDSPPQKGKQWIRAVLCPLMVKGGQNLTGVRIGKAQDGIVKPAPGVTWHFPPTKTAPDGA